LQSEKRIGQVEVHDLQKQIKEMQSKITHQHEFMHKISEQQRILQLEKQV
jgi:hypothetical protein